MHSLSNSQTTTENLYDDRVCPACNGRGWPIDDPEFLAGGAPHAECVTCEGTGRISARAAGRSRDQSGMAGEGEMEVTIPKFLVDAARKSIAGEFGYHEPGYRRALLELIVKHADGEGA